MKKKTIIITLLIILVSVVILSNLDDDNKDNTKDSSIDDITPDSEDTWSQIRATDVAELSDGWSTPIRVEVNLDGWEDGAFISGDGNTLYFVYYPGDMMADLQIGRASCRERV